ncbi:MAG: hypothetical protein KJP25_03205 [Gammaproteobacteria bacterium]|nr:hypothetical protein [Gammaproteobacteria bacterium]MBT8150589.1 hypothetical protein [Gammaproteobacteria bacterium]NND38386.1 hypothetical protein [Pseudomonadales bacterium]NNM11189.1 hypothetical protein [Pseudomonadales bacterium]
MEESALGAYGLSIDGFVQQTNAVRQNANWLAVFQCEKRSAACLFTRKIQIVNAASD